MNQLLKQRVQNKEDMGTVDIGLPKEKKRMLNTSLKNSNKIKLHKLNPIKETSKKKKNENYRL